MSPVVGGSQHLATQLLATALATPTLLQLGPDAFWGAKPDPDGTGYTGANVQARRARRDARRGGPLSWQQCSRAVGQRGCSSFRCQIPDIRWLALLQQGISHAAAVQGKALVAVRVELEEEQVESHVLQVPGRAE